MAENWDDLRLFIAVARERSLSAAGKLLGLDPATLGRRMTRFEQRMQTALFARSPQGYALTEAGAQLLERAEAVEQAMRLARAGVAVSYTHLRAHETGRNLVCRLLLEKKKICEKWERLRTSSPSLI